MNYILIEDTDQPTNPWLELILESNKNTKAPTAYWNDMQSALIQYEFWPRMENYSHSFTEVLGRLEVEEFYQKLCDATANDKIDFSGVEFADVNFCGAIFLRAVNFSGTKFQSSVSFERTKFFHSTSFEAAQFYEGAFFSQVRFDAKTSFKFTEFGCNKAIKKRAHALFSGIFADGLEFHGSKFEGDCEFRSVRCVSKQDPFAFVSFYDMKFCGDTLFSDVEFEQVKFEKIKFMGKVNFLATKFASHINFSDVEFMQAVHFGGEHQKTACHFVGNLIFNLVTVNEIVIFNWAHVKGNFYCFYCPELKFSSFRDCRISGAVWLIDSNIFGELKLQDHKNTLNLRGTNFVNRPPELFGSDLKPDSDLAFTLPAKPNPDHINIYEDLRQHAERLGKLEEKKRFVHAELSCRAIDPQKSPAERFVWWLYYITSDYGTSIYRPLGWLFFLFLISAVPWAGYAIWFSPMSVWSALSYNILQAVPFTGHLSSALLKNFPELPMSLYFIAGPVALLNPIFWFLIGLGMRYKLRLAR